LIVNCTLVPAGPLAGVAEKVTVRPPDVSLAEAVEAVVVVVGRPVVVVDGLVVVVGRDVVEVVATTPGTVVGVTVVAVAPTVVLGAAVPPAVVGAP
jgi:hypothetical protein